MALNSQSDVSVATFVRGLSITISLALIIRVTTLPLGIKWNKEDIATSATVKKNFFRDKEIPMEDKDGVMMIHVGIGGHPPIPPSQFHQFSYFLCLVVFRVLNF